MKWPLFFVGWALPKRCVCVARTLRGWNFPPQHGSTVFPTPGDAAEGDWFPLLSKTLFLGVRAIILFASAKVPSLFWQPPVVFSMRHVGGRPFFLESDLGPLKDFRS